MKDKLLKLDHRRLNAIEVINSCAACDHFYFWLKERNPLGVENKCYSLKRLAKEFLADFPGYYKKYLAEDEKIREEIRIIKEIRCYEE